MGGALPNSPPPIESRYSIDPMTTPLTKLVKRELKIKGHAYIVSMSPDGLKIALKGKRKGLELSWADLVSGDAALAVALNASIAASGQLQPARSPVRKRRPSR